MIDRLRSMIQLCEDYYEGYHKAMERDPEGTSAVDNWDPSRKKYLALEVLEAYKSGELQASLAEASLRQESVSRSMLFMDDNGNTEILLISVDQVINGEWFRLKHTLEDRGYQFICVGKEDVK